MTGDHMKKKWDALEKFRADQLVKLADALKGFDDSEPPKVASLHVTCLSCFEDDFIVPGLIPRCGMVVFFVPKKECPLGHMEEPVD